MKKGLYCLLALLTVSVAAGCSVNQPDNTDNTTTENASESLSRYDEVLSEAEASADGWSDSCALGEDSWLIYYAKDGETLRIVQTEGTDVVEEHALAFREYCDVNCAFISMVDADTGYILCCSSPGLSQMSKYLFKTTDGWNSYELTSEPDIHNYPTDMAFSDENTGIITTDYHGYDQYAYQTVDGGNSWNALTVDDFSDEAISYVEGDLIEWENGQWTLTVSKILPDSREASVYRSKNGTDWSLDSTNN